MPQTAISRSAGKNNRQHFILRRNRFPEKAPRNASAWNSTSATNPHESTPQIQFSDAHTHPGAHNFRAPASKFHDSASKLADSNSKLIMATGKFVAADSRIDTAAGKFIMADSRLDIADSKIDTADGKFIMEAGKFDTADSRLIMAVGRIGTAEGKLGDSAGKIDKSAGKYIPTLPADQKNEPNGDFGTSRQAAKIEKAVAGANIFSIFAVSLIVEAWPPIHYAGRNVCAASGS